MKKIFIVLLSGCMLLTFASCKKSSSGSPSGGTGSSGRGSITGTSGAIFSVTGNNTFFERTLPNSTGNITSDTLISILATISSTANLDLQLFNVSTPGTYTCNSFTAASSGAVIYNAAIDSSYNTVTAISPGSITVTAISSTTISGTYNVTVETLNHTSLNLTGTFTGNY